RLDKGDAVPRQDLSRPVRRIDPQKVYLKAQYLLDQEDQEVLADLELEKKPIRMSYSRRLGGDVPIIRFQPSPERPRSRFDKGIEALRKAKLGSMRTMIPELSLIDDETEDDETEDGLARRPRTLDERLQDIIPVIANENETINDRLLREADTIAD